MERSVEIRTPESIAFSYELAGLGSRFLAMFADLIIQIGIVVAAFTALVVIASHFPQDTRPETIRDARLGESLGIALLSMFLFFVFYGYFILFETFWDGRTPGKKLLGIRVVRDGGYPLDFASALIRNIVRIGEQTLGFYTIAGISSLLSPENKRVGDYAAGTIVVREARASYRNASKSEQ